MLKLGDGYIEYDYIIHSTFVYLKNSKIKSYYIKSEVKFVLLFLNVLMYMYNVFTIKNIFKEHSNKSFASDANVQPELQHRLHH